MMNRKTPWLKQAAGALKAAVHVLSLNCREASRLQSAAPGPPLSPAKRLGLRLHLLLCHWCRRYGKNLRFLRQAAHEHPEESTTATPGGLSSEARERLERSLRERAG